MIRVLNDHAFAPASATAAKTFRWRQSRSWFPRGLTRFLDASRHRVKAAPRARIALAVANVNGCDYRNAAHGFIAKNRAKLSDAEIALNRSGRSTDARADAAVRLAVEVAVGRGRASEETFANALTSVKQDLLSVH